jgi:hypothetical protein
MTKWRLVPLDLRTGMIAEPLFVCVREQKNSVSQRKLGFNSSLTEHDSYGVSER